MSWWTDIFGEPADWRLVKTLESEYLNPDINQDNLCLTYYLYEDQNGERKIDVIDSAYSRGDLDISTLRKTDWVFRNTFYRRTIRPWLDGRLDPEIPSYEQVPVDDFARALKGKK